MKNNESNPIEDLKKHSKNIIEDNYTRDVEKIKFALDESALVAITDNKGDITYVNKKFCEVSEYTEQELLGQNHRILKSGYHPQKFYKELWNTISSGKTWYGEIKNVSKTGKYYWVKTTIVPFRNESGEINEYIAIRTEITDRKEAEERLLIANEVMIQNAQLKQIDHDKDEFAAMVSHELKTPLIPISGYAELFIDGSLGNLSELQREKMQIIYENSVRLTILIQDILDAQKIELKELRLDIHLESIKEIAKRSINIFMQIAKQKNVKLVDNTQDIMVQCDSDRILQVFNNIISNALKFVPVKLGTISINNRIDNDTIVISVIDNGIGIPKSKQDDLFKKFYQVDTSLTRKSGGTGLGLAISRGIIEAHRGKIWVESKENHGTTIH